MQAEQTFRPPVQSVSQIALLLPAVGLSHTLTFRSARGCFQADKETRVFLQKESLADISLHARGELHCRGKNGVRYLITLLESA